MLTKMRQSHQVFLQAFMSRTLLNAADVFKLYKKSREMTEEVIVEGEEREGLVEFVGVINSNLKIFGMEVKKGTDELDGTSYYGLVNTAESSITLCASQYTENELEFFKKLVEMIMTSGGGVIGSIAAVNSITDSLTKKMTKSDADYLLERLQEAKWLDKTDEGKLYLTARAILELEQYIFDMYPENAERCNMCKKLVVQGQTCAKCGIRLHNHCYQKYFKDGKENKCPQCKAPWVSSSGGTPQPSTSGAQSRKRKSTAVENGEEVIYTRNGHS